MIGKVKRKIAGEISNIIGAAAKDRRQRSEVRSQRSEVRGQRAEDG